MTFYRRNLFSTSGYLTSKAFIIQDTHSRLAFAEARGSIAGAARFELADPIRAFALAVRWIKPLSHTPKSFLFC